MGAPKNRQAGDHGIAAIASHSGAAFLVDREVLLAIEAQQIGTGAVEHSLQGEAKENARISTDQPRPGLPQAPGPLELQQGLTTAPAVEAKDEGIHVSSHRTAKVVQVAPVVFFDGCPRVDPTDFQPLSSREGSIVELQ